MARLLESFLFFYRRSTGCNLLKKALILFTLFLIPANSLLADDDVQLWNMQQIHASPHQKIGLRVQGEEWLTRDLSRLSLNNIEAGFLWKPLKFFEIGPFYRYEHVDMLNGPDTNENRYTLEGVLRFKRGPWQLNDRNRIEYREKNLKDFWVYRNQLRLSYDQKFSRLILSPYIAHELFHRGDGRGVNEHRTSLGWQTRFSPRFGLTLFYLLRQTKGRSDWKSDHVLGTTLQFYL